MKVGQGAGILFFDPLFQEFQSHFLPRVQTVLRVQPFFGQFHKICEFHVPQLLLGDCPLNPLHSEEKKKKRCCVLFGLHIHN